MCRSNSLSLTHTTYLFSLDTHHLFSIKTTCMRDCKMTMKIMIKVEGKTLIEKGQADRHNNDGDGRGGCGKGLLAATLSLFS